MSGFQIDEVTIDASLSRKMSPTTNNKSAFTRYTSAKPMLILGRLEVTFPLLTIKSHVWFSSFVFLQANH
jgi:hypothetical protein